MIRRIGQALGRSFSGIHSAAYVIGFATFISLVIALIRDRMLVQFMGTGLELDIYYAAFKLPDIFFALLASFLSAFVIIPFLHKKDIEERSKFLSTLLFSFLLSSLAIFAIVFLFTRDILVIFYPSLLYSDLGADLIFLQRLFMLQFILLGISALFTSLIQMQNKFIAFSIAPVLYNLGIIFGLLFFYPNFGLRGLGYGVIFGALSHLVITITFISDFRLTPKGFVHELKEIGHFIIKVYPRTISLFLQQITFLVLFSILAAMGYGALSLFQLAFNIQSAPFSIIAVSYSIAAFPTLSKLYSENNFSDFVSHINLALRHVMFWAIPIALLTLLMRAHIVRILFGSSSFTWSDTKIVAAILAVLTLSLLFQSINILATRAYYAASFVKLPLFINIFTSIMMIGFTIIFKWFIDKNEWLSELLAVMLKLESNNYSVILSVPIALFLSSFLTSFIFIYMLNKHFHHKIFGLKEKKSLIQILFASVISLFGGKISMLLISGLIGLNTFKNVFIQFVIISCIFISIYIFVLFILKNLELKESLRILKR